MDDTPEALPPPPEVLAAFGLRGSAPVPLAGGRGRAWCTDNVVLKPVNDVAEATWVGEVLSGLEVEGIRIERPVRAEAGGWMVDGWSAWERLPGDHDSSGRWTEVLRAGDQLNAALRGLARPAFLDARTDAWAVADRQAWGEEPVRLLHQELQPLAQRLTPFLRADDSPGQVIHGDLTRNVLFAPGLVPAVIDFTPYWRPPRFCSAVVVIDALLWHGAPEELVDAVSGAHDRTSLLARAALYRLVAADRLAAENSVGERSDVLSRVVADHDRVRALIDRAGRSGRRPGPPAGPTS